MYLNINHRMLGMPPDSNPVRQQLQEGILNDINMGYYAPNEIKPHSPVLYHAKESKYIHPLSLVQSTRKYAYSKLQNVLPLELYLNLPYFMIDDLLEGLRIGSEERQLDDDRHKAAAGKSKEEREAEQMEKDAMNLMRQADS